MKFLSVCAIVRNEGPYISEWIEFHLLQGVEHFFIYDNGSTDNTLEVLKPYMKEGLVTTTLWPGKARQVEAYANCIEKMRAWPNLMSEWVAFIDVDEFLWSPLHEPLGKVTDAINYLSLTYDPSTIAAHWILYGSNNHEGKSDGLIIERFTRRDKDINQHCKSIVRIRDCISPANDPHTFRVRGKVIDERGNMLGKDYALTKGGTTDLVRISHFHTKSKEEYFKRKNENPDAGSGRDYGPERILEMFLAHDKNDVEDTSLLQYVDLIKTKLTERIC